PSREAFSEAVTDGVLPPPAYLGMHVARNKKGYERFENVLSRRMTAVSIEEFEKIAQQSAGLTLDTPANRDGPTGCLPQSINLGINGDFAPWVGAMIVDVNQPILLVTHTGMEEETVTRLSRVGFDNVLGHLEGCFQSWEDAGKEIDTVHRITATEFASQIEGK